MFSCARAETNSKQLVVITRCKMALLLLMTVQLLTAMLLVVVAPEVLEVMLEIVVSVVLLVTYVLLVAVSFSIASLVFFVICMRFSDDSQAFDDSDDVNQNQFWMWIRWG